MSNNFDDISKGLASRASRRGALRLFGAAVVGAVAATFRPGGANAGNLASHCYKVCKRFSGQDRATCMRRCVCEGLGRELCGTSQICCPPGTRCQAINGNGIDHLVINGTIGRLTCVPILEEEFV